MIIYMSNNRSDFLCVTNRKLCQGDLFYRIKILAAKDYAGIILREKDLSESEYFSLAKEVVSICSENNMKCILHNFPDAAIKLDVKALHMPLNKLQEMSEENRKKFEILGASCHSIEDAILAQKLGCTYITAGHIFETDCKKGLAGRGLKFLSEVCESVTIPVYAIGGISRENIQLVKAAGAKGGCIMSSAMNGGENEL